MVELVDEFAVPVEVCKITNGVIGIVEILVVLDSANDAFKLVVNIGV